MSCASKRKQCSFKTIPNLNSYMAISIFIKASGPWWSHFNRHFTVWPAAIFNNRSSSFKLDFPPKTPNIQSENIQWEKNNEDLPSVCIWICSTKQLVTHWTSLSLRDYRYNQYTIHYLVINVCKIKASWNKV